MRITISNAFRIYALPLSQLRTYLPKIFDRIRTRAPEDGELVEVYITGLERQIAREKREFGSGWSPLQEACIECGIVETFMFLLHHRDDYHHSPVCNSLSIFVDFGAAGTSQQRQAFREKLVESDCLAVYLDIMSNGGIALQRHNAIRVIRSLCSDLSYGELLSVTQTAELMETLTRTALERTGDYSTELRDPTKSWQVLTMVPHIRTDTVTASRYGKRWFAIAQELLLWAAQSLLCRYPVPSRQYILEVVEARPQIVDILLDIGNLPRPDWYPEAQAPSIAMELLAQIFQFPISIITGLNPPMSGPWVEARDAACKATISSINLLVSRPNWVRKIAGAWNNLDKETMSKVQRQLDRIVVDWSGEPPEEEDIQAIAEFRGDVRISVLNLITMATYSENVKEADLLSFLRITYLATQASLAPAKDDVDPDSYDELLEALERAQNVFRAPMSVAHMSDEELCDHNATHNIPPQSIGAPTALLRLLTILSERGILDKVQSWTALPEGCAPGTDLRQVKQIMGRPVLKKLIPLVTKRMAHQREMIRPSANESQWHARAQYAEVARLGAAVLGLDRATGGRWRDSMRGLKKELVLCLGNAAEMSIRRSDFHAALYYALSADTVVHTADRNEGITEDATAKNRRRIQTARGNVGDSLVAGISGLAVGEP